MGHVLLEKVLTEFGKVQVTYDECSESPLEYEEDFRFILLHNKYSLGCNLSNEEKEKFNLDNYSSFDEMVKDNLSTKDWVLPISLHDHSGLTLSIGVSSGWDSGQVGFVYLKEEDKKLLDMDDPSCESFVDTLLDQLNNYLNGDCYRADYFIGTPLFYRDGSQASVKWEVDYDYSVSLFTIHYESLVSALIEELPEELKPKLTT